jgi:hypothetical protein
MALQILNLFYLSIELILFNLLNILLIMASHQISNTQSFHDSYLAHLVGYRKHKSC